MFSIEQVTVQEMDGCIDKQEGKRDRGWGKGGR
jgi:hypothetical protein